MLGAEGGASLLTVRVVPSSWSLSCAAAVNRDGEVWETRG